MELIKAMPPAAAAPPSRLVGRLQNQAGATIRLAAATHTAINATSGEEANADTASATPATPVANAPTPRAFRLRSHQGGIRVTAVKAQSQGKAVTNPTSSPMLVPSSRATCAGR